MGTRDGMTMIQVGDRYLFPVGIHFRSDWRVYEVEKIELGVDQTMQSPDAETIVTVRDKKTDEEYTWTGTMMGYELWTGRMKKEAM